MRSIQEYYLCMDYTLGDVTISMPDGALILSITKRGDSIHIFTLVDASYPTIPRRFYISTSFGSSIPDNYDFIDSLFWDLHGSAFVFEILDSPRKKKR